MHGSSLLRMAWFVNEFLGAAPPGARVLDVGSATVAGGSYRQLYPPERFNYTGLDLAPAENVDYVPAHPYFWQELADNSFFAAISGQAFEHVEFFWLTAAEMARVLAPGGYLCLLLPRGFARHRYPVDCYRFDADGAVAIARWCRLDILHVSTDMAPAGAAAEWHMEGCEDTLLVARKPANWPGPLASPPGASRPADLDALASGFLPCARGEAETVPILEHLEQRREYEQRLAAKNAEIARLAQALHALENSNSWRITRPLRALRKIARSLTISAASK